LVFMQFEQISKDKRINLPKPSVDTGMGLERMAAVMQGTHDNYKIDLFKEIINYSENLIKKKLSNNNIASYKVVADHLRALAFLISDGVTPSNEGRGYVLRRIMRRAMRHVHSLGKTEPVLYDILPCLVNLMKNEYPQLDKAFPLIKETLLTEEEKFSSLLKNGLKILENEISNITKDILPGSIAFKLYDTYGFPVDLTQDILKEKNIKVDHEEFQKIIDEKKQEARTNWKGTGSQGIDKIWYEIKDRFGPTEFLGYNFNKAEGKLLAIVKDGKLVSSVNKGDKFQFILNQTPFYAESGGQVGDKGKIVSKKNISEIEGTQKFFGDLYVHLGEVISGTFQDNTEVVMLVDENRRNKIKSYHSATHLLHAALRNTLGKHVSQKGSYVGPDRLRFDFSHMQALKLEEIKKINSIVNSIISSDGFVETKIMSQDKASKLGAMALFGEKYGDEVRVVSMGAHNDKIFSIELCGGTHVRKLSEIGNFEIISESSIASGVRRIEALRGDELINYNNFLATQQKKNEKIIKNQIKELEEKIISAGGDIGRFKNLDNKEKIIKLKNFSEALNKVKILKDPKKNIINDKNLKNFLVRFQYIKGLPGKDLREIIDNTKKEKNNLLIFIFSEFENKLSIAVGVSGVCLDRYDASFFAKKISTFIKGKGGGGRKDFAQAGGEIQKDINLIYNYLDMEIDNLSS